MSDVIRRCIECDRSMGDERTLVGMLYTHLLCISTPPDCENGQTDE